MAMLERVSFRFYLNINSLISKIICFKNRNSNQYVQAQTITVHKKYVNSVVVVYTLEEYPNGLILTGSNDKTIAIHDIESNKTVAVLEEHDGSGMLMFLFIFKVYFG